MAAPAPSDSTICLLQSALLPDPSTSRQIRELLRSNSPPPYHIPFTISALSDELARYDARIEALREELAGLEAARAALKAYYDDCGALLAPIRRLPSELLVKIFGLLSTEENESRTAFPTSSSAAIFRLSQAHLLVLSRVCSRFHTLVINTSTLWNTIWLDSIMWHKPRDRNRMLFLLGRMIERGGNCLLNVFIQNTSGAPYDAALKLLAEHSERWRTANILCPYDDMRYLSLAKGNLAHLKTLSLSCWGPSSNIGIFELAPNLRSITVNNGTSSHWPAFVALPNSFFLRLRSVRISEILEGALGEVSSTSVLSRLSPMTKVTLKSISTCMVDGSDIEPVTSSISALAIESDQFSANLRRTIAKIIQSLTLPALQELELVSTDFPDLVFWPHTEFLALSARSSFHNHLRSLQLLHCIIEGAELIECLSGLPLLESLAISDRRGVNDSTHQPLITDSLLAQLTLAPGHPSAVPRLHVFQCRSLLQFDNQVFINFLLSRVQEGRLFETQLLCLPESRRDLDPILSGVHEACLRGQLKISVGGRDGS
ncbi:hypothetical protein B0H17DRAFT_1332327 [Mycena rosella]|uniref:F-box domain-containing protein n=1 Tax=Mycena rosella TaxID=1033263 RepID=A0AAD7DBW3_MYCRO|nr:hypothetical protein B0H17DRAFT_1332327 [Mycena rosella]